MDHRSPDSRVAAAEIDRINTFFPLLPSLGLRWARTRPWEGLRVAVNAHLTTLTGALMRELSLGGGEWVMCGTNEATTDANVVALLREQGIAVHTGRGDVANRHRATLESDPHLIADVGFELCGALLDRSEEQAALLRGAVEITRTGVNRWTQRQVSRAAPLPLRLVNLNDTEMKSHVENRHGVGNGLWGCVTQITGLHLAGRKVVVIGYGPVGQGIASVARNLGANVEVVDTDDMRRLVASYDGFPTPTMADGLERADIAVTATGCSQVVGVNALAELKSDIVLVNAGHGHDEIDVEGLRAEAVEGDQLSELCLRLRLRPKGPWLTVLGGGNPLNIVMNAGSPEPVLMQFALLGLTLEWLAQGEMNLEAPPAPSMFGCSPVPRELELDVARRALRARR